MSKIRLILPNLDRVASHGGGILQLFEGGVSFDGYRLSVRGWGLFQEGMIITYIATILVPMTIIPKSHNSIQG